jgi:glutathione-specific gamma-glutamylcyclotransferase
LTVAGGGGDIEADRPAAANASAGDDLWVFAYGSLMWNPCFPHAEQRPALLRGYHRSLCILSILNRGSIERPGLALGLDRGGSCRGIAFRIEAPCVPSARAELWAREMSHDVYAAKMLSVRLEGGARVPALVFVARPEHAQYVGDLPPERAAALVAQGTGCYGTALDYLRNVVRHLDEFGIVDPPLRRVLHLAEALACAGKGDQA